MKKIGTRLLEDLRVLNLKRVEHVSPDTVLCAVIVKFGLALGACVFQRSCCTVSASIAS